MLKKQIIKPLFLFIVCILGNTLSAQISKGDMYFERGDYVRAISKYKKASKSPSPEQQDALVKLANTYKLINDYSNAESAYAAALEIDTLSLANEVFYDYAQVLKANNKYEEAAAQYKHYLRLNPKDENAKNALKFCREIKYYLSMPIEYTVTPTSNINTERSEFSPFVSGDKLIFVAEREKFDIVTYSQQETNGQPYLNMFISNIDNGRVKKAKEYSTILNTDYHDGPACISADGNTIYFNRSEYKEKKGFVNNSKLYTAQRSGNDWKKVTPIDELNSDSYSIAHPSISSDSKVLFFSSNMPGGYGGKDIWLSKRDTVNNKWTKPINLGPDINTSGDEMFPSIRKDGTLFFSSNGLPGYGGLDIYSATQVDDKWLLNRNEGLDLNSNKDDFGITFLNDSIGYFSSDRVGGKGRDDIYHYHFQSKMMNVDGVILLTENTKDFAKKKKVYLMAEDGTVLDSVYTDMRGYFKFKNVPNDRKYMTAIDSEDPEFIGKARFYLAEKDSSVIHRISNRFAKNKYVFKNLPIEPNALPDLSTNDDLVLAGNLLYGIDQKPLKNTRLSLVSDKGDVLEETTTNEFGSFAFRNIPADANYLISIEDSDIHLPSGTKIVLTNRTGKELKTFIKSSNKFSFKLLSADKSTISEMDAEDEHLVMDVFGYMYDQNYKPLVNTKIKVRDEKGGDVQEFTTNDKGRFKLKNLYAAKDYVFEAEEGDPSLKGVSRIYIADSKGKIYKVVELSSNGTFAFKIVEIDKAMLGEFMVDDPWMTVAKIKEKEKPKENVDIFGFLYDENKNPIPYAKLRVHDVNGGDLQKISTNDKGIFSFKKIASEKDYIFETEANDPVLKGLKRVYIADGKGDIYKVLELVSGKFTFKLLNADKAALGEYIVDDPWMKVALMKDKAKDVADIMGFMYDQNKQPIANIKVIVRSEDGSEEQQLKTNGQGRFNFQKLSPEKNYIFEADEHDPNLKGVKKIYIADAQGEIYKVLELNEGTFSFKILDLDKVALADMATNDNLWLQVAKMKEKTRIKEQQQTIVKLNEEPPSSSNNQQTANTNTVVATKTTNTTKAVTKEPSDNTPKREDDDTTMIKIENAHFAYGKYGLDQKAAEILDQVAIALSLHPHLKVEISGHADCRSSSEFNMRLSIKRANSAADYLVSKGIPRTRIKTIGYGETRILNRCVDGVKCSESEHRINRRTEFRFISSTPKTNKPQ